MNTVNTAENPQARHEPEDREAPAGAPEDAVDATPTGEIGRAHV